MLSEFRKKKVKRIFEFYDVNRNGVIETSDIDGICDTFCHEYGWAKGSETDVTFRAGFHALWSGLITAADVNKDNKVSLEEFYANYDVTIKDYEAFHQYIYPFFPGFFPVLDTDGDHDLSFEEFSRFYRGFRNTDADATAAFPLLDFDSNGIITRDEFFLAFYLFHMSEDEAHPSKHFFGILK